VMMLQPCHQSSTVGFNVNLKMSAVAIKITGPVSNLRRAVPNLRLHDRYDTFNDLKREAIEKLRQLDTFLPRTGAAATDNAKRTWISTRVTKSPHKADEVRFTRPKKGAIGKSAVTAVRSAAEFSAEATKSAYATRPLQTFQQLQSRR
jgi:hypothetical protein